MEGVIQLDSKDVRCIRRQRTGGPSSEDCGVSDYAQAVKMVKLGKGSMGSSRDGVSGSQDQ